MKQERDKLQAENKGFQQRISVLESMVVAPPRASRRGVVAEDRAQYHDRGSTFYDSLDEDVHVSDDAEASTEGSQFGKRQEPETKPETKPDEGEEVN